MKAASNESFGYNTDEIVSSDIVGMRYGSLFDATQTMVLPINDELSEVQVVSWYDNENSYTSQMVRTIKHFGKLLNSLIGVRLFRIRQRPLEVRSEKDRASFHRIGNFVSIR